MALPVSAQRALRALPADLARAIRVTLAGLPDDDDEPSPVEPFGDEYDGPPPDPYSDPLDGEDAWLADLPGELLDDYLAATAGTDGARAVTAVPRELGFASGGAAERVEPGPVLAGLTAGACGSGLGGLSEDELVGVMRAWRKLASWAAAGELAAVSELERRRAADVAAGTDPSQLEHVDSEIAAALTLTTPAAGRLLGFAAGVARLPATRDALAAGLIDTGKAHALVDELSGLDDARAREVEAKVIGKAPDQTSGQLRRAAHRAVLATDPGAAERRYQQARLEARVELWPEPAGTASLAGRDLAAAEALAADRRIDSLARDLKDHGAEGTLPQLRAQVFAALLLGRPVFPATGPGQACQGGGETKLATSGGGTGEGQPGPAPPARPLRGQVNLTLPLSTWLGASDAPGEVAGYGPLPASEARALAAQLATSPAARWCLTITDATGRALAHGCTTTRRPGPGTAGTGPPGTGPPGTGPPGRVSAPGWALPLKFALLAAGDCDHRHESKGYVPSPRLRHLVQIRQRTCTAPGCRRAAVTCDLDHTVPYERGGRTCECGLAPLCRRHHRAKHTQGWQLAQPQPGVMVWVLPHGRVYRVSPEPYPAG